MVITLSAEAFGTQDLVVEAAAKAGVRRVVPSEFGSVSPASIFVPVWSGSVCSDLISVGGFVC